MKFRVLVIESGFIIMKVIVKIIKADGNYLRKLRRRRRGEGSGGEGNRGEEGRGE